MKTTTILSALALAATNTLAAPLEARHDLNSPFELYVTYTNSQGYLHGSLQANGGNFWINKNSSSYCPSSIGSSCPTSNLTTFIGSNPAGTLSLNVAVPGGQQVYIAPNGLLSYTVAHSANIPAGSITSGLVANTGNNLFNKFYSFWLCNEAGEDTEAYRIWLAYRNVEGIQLQNGNKGNNTCSLVNLNARDVKTGATAWQY